MILNKNTAKKIENTEFRFWMYGGSGGFGHFQNSIKSCSYLIIIIFNGVSDRGG